MLSHLLKWQFQPERRGQSWNGTIRRERINFINRENESRGLQITSDELKVIYVHARRDAARETGLSPHAFPTACPYSVDFLRDLFAMPD